MVFVPAENATKYFSAPVSICSESNVDLALCESKKGSWWRFIDSWQGPQRCLFVKYSFSFVQEDTFSIVRSFGNVSKSFHFRWKREGFFVVSTWTRKWKHIRVEGVLEASLRYHKLKVTSVCRTWKWGKWRRRRMEQLCLSMDVFQLERNPSSTRHY